MDRVFIFLSRYIKTKRFLFLCLECLFFGISIDIMFNTKNSMLITFCSVIQKNSIVWKDFHLAIRNQSADKYRVFTHLGMENYATEF